MNKHDYKRWMIELAKMAHSNSNDLNTCRSRILHRDSTWGGEVRERLNRAGLCWLRPPLGRRFESYPLRHWVFGAIERLRFRG